MISIIVPVYNVEPYLPKCLDSIISQTYRDIEVLLIDGRYGEQAYSFARTTAVPQQPAHHGVCFRIVHLYIMQILFLMIHHDDDAVIVEIVMPRIRKAQ